MFEKFARKYLAKNAGVSFLKNKTKTEKKKF